MAPTLDKTPSNEERRFDQKLCDQNALTRYLVPSPVYHVRLAHMQMPISDSAALRKRSFTKGTLKVCVYW